MKKNSHNNETNSRVGRIWPSENLNDIENEDNSKSIINSKSRADQNPNQ